jgi:hypothetical protein
MRILTNTVWLTFVACSFASSVQAQTVIRPLVGIGYVRGSEEVSPKVPGTPRQSPARVSGFLHGYVGGSYLPSVNTAVELTVGFQGGATKDGQTYTYEFTRVPVELGYFYEPMDGLSLGGGVRKSISPKLSRFKYSAEKAYEPSITSNVGAFVQVKAGSGDHVSLSLKYVFEKFKSPQLGDINGNHFGIYLEFAR